MATNQLCRVTVVAPNTRMDIALPDHVRLCDMQSDLLAHAADGPHGEDLLDDGGDQGGWVLTRLGGAPLDPRKTPREHNIMDGEELYFVPVADVGPQAVFDDIIDAMATANQERGSKWQTPASLRFGVGLTITALLGGAALCFFTGTTAAMWTAFGVGGGLLIAALIFTRALGRAFEGAVVGLMGAIFGFVGGMLTLGQSPTDFSAPQLMVGGASMAVFAVAAGIGVPTAAPVFSGVTVSAAMLTGGAALSTFMDASPAQAGAVAAAVIMGLIPAMPMLAFRVARLPMPTIPRSPQQLRSDSEAVDSHSALRRSERADEHLTGLLSAAAVVAGVGAVTLAWDGNTPSIIVASLWTALLFMRARVFVSVRQRLPFLLAAATGMAALAMSGWLFWSDTPRFVMLIVALLVTAAITLSYVLGVAGKPIAPTWGRLLDILEIIMFVAVIPLTLWVWDAYWWVRTVNG